MIKSKYADLLEQNMMQQIDAAIAGIDAGLSPFSFEGSRRQTISSGENLSNNICIGKLFPQGVQPNFPILYLICGHYHGEGDAQGFKMPLSAADLVGFAGAELQKVFGAFRFTDQIQCLIIVLQDGPIRIILAYGSIDLKPAG